MQFPGSLKQISHTYHLHTVLLIITVMLLFTTNLFIYPTKACHNVGTYESDYTTPKINFIPEDTVYGKETYGVEVTLRLRIRDPDNNVKYVSDPSHAKVITCSYQLAQDAQLGEWNIQVGRFDDGSWNWLNEPGDIAYFHVLDQTTDTYPPETSLSVNGPYHFRHSDDTRWVTSSSLLTLTSSDYFVGIDQLFYNYNGYWNMVQDDTVTFSLPAQQRYAIQYYAIDYNGNTENTQVDNFNVDNAAPKSWILFNSYFLKIIAARDRGVGSCTIHFGYKDSNGNMQWIEGNNPYYVYFPPDTFSYYSEDALQNTESLRHWTETR